MRRSWFSLFLFICLCGTSSPLRAQFSGPGPDTAKPYLSKHWRDSVNNYRGRVEAYHQEFYSYDWAMLFSSVPVLGRWYVNQTGYGIVTATERLAAIGVAAAGTWRLAGGYAHTGFNIGMIAVGIIGWGVLKYFDVVGVQHEVSHRNEDLVEKFGIETPDIVPGSIRYPRKEWPDWITQPPPPRQPQNAREAVDRPIPSLDDQSVTQIKFQISF